MSWSPNRSRSRRIPAALLLFSLLWSMSPPALLAQTTSGPILKIVILDGEGAINNIRQRTAHEPIVQVEDENRKPVAGALVLFTLPDRGAGAVFADGTKTSMVYTDAQGKAIARGIQPNQVTGKFKIKVDVSYQGRTASAVINQSNITMAAAASSAAVSGKTIAILSAVAAAVATGVVVATRKEEAKATPATGITIGNPTVGRP